MKRIKKDEPLTELIAVLLRIKTADLMERFLRDLCTPGELKDLAERWQVSLLLDEGDLSYRDISAQTGTSLATITRVARFLKTESYQGYRQMIDTIQKSKVKGNK